MEIRDKYKLNKCKLYREAINGKKVMKNKSKTRII